MFWSEKYCLYLIHSCIGNEDRQWLSVLLEWQATSWLVLCVVCCRVSAQLVKYQHRHFDVEQFVPRPKSSRFSYRSLSSIHLSWSDHNRAVLWRDCLVIYLIVCLFIFRWNICSFVRSTTLQSLLELRQPPDVFVSGTYTYIVGCCSLVSRLAMLPNCIRCSTLIFFSLFLNWTISLGFVMSERGYRERVTGKLWLPPLTPNFEFTSDHLFEMWIVELFDDKIQRRRVKSCPLHVFIS